MNTFVEDSLCVTYGTWYFLGFLIGSVCWHMISMIFGFFVPLLEYLVLLLERYWHFNFQMLLLCLCCVACLVCQSMWMEVRHAMRCIFCEADTVMADMHVGTYSCDKLDDLVER